MKPLRLDVVISRALRYLSMNGKYSCVLKTLPIQYDRRKILILFRSACCSWPPGNLRPSPAIADFFCLVTLCITPSQNNIFHRVEPPPDAI
jgi:hypothetical protein